MDQYTWPYIQWKFKMYLKSSFLPQYLKINLMLDYCAPPQQKLGISYPHVRSKNKLFNIFFCTPCRGRFSLKYCSHIINRILQHTDLKLNLRLQKTYQNSANIIDLALYFYLNFTFSVISWICFDRRTSRLTQNTIITQWDEM